MKEIDAIKEIIKKFPKNWGQSLNSKANKKLLDWINSNLPKELLKYALKTKIYWILNNLKDFPICKNPNCSNKIKNDVVNLSHGFSNFCSLKCMRETKDTWIKAKETRLKHNKNGKYFADDWKEKTIKKNLEKYGVEWSSQDKKIYEKTKRTKLEKYGDEFFTNKEKREQTNIEKYGKKNYNNPKKISNTKKSYSEERKIEIESQREQTNIEKYGKPFLQQIDIFKEKSFNTKLEKYGDGFFTNKEKREQTNIEKYGCKNPANSSIVRKTAKKRWHFDNKYFASSYEIVYYIWLTDHNVKFEYQPNLFFKYFVNGIEKHYYPDFLVNNEIHEIKGLHYFLNKDPNNKMICIYDRSRDEEFEAKHQCMIQNNVKIITDCSLYFNYVYSKYGKKYLKQFKNK